jgi:AraC-like DNA-binding protein
MQVSILMVRALVGVIERAGASRAEFLSAAGIDAQLIEDRDARLPVVEYLKAIDAAILVSGDPALGLHLGEQSSSVMFDVLGPLAERAATLRQCVETISRYSRLIAEGHDPQLVEAGELASIRFAALRGEFAAVRLTAEFALVGLVRMLEQFVDGAARSTKVCFAYEAPSYVAEYQRIFEGAEHFGQPFTGVEFPAAWLETAQLYQSPDLYALLKTEADRNLGRLERVAALSDRIKLILASRSPRELPTIDEMARALDMSARSVRRRLLAEGKSYGALVERCRVHAAKRMLEQPRASIQDTAYALGFAAPAAFHRAFKRWTGMTPKQYLEQR